MTLIIVLLLIFGYLLIATCHLTGVNKSAIAVFIGTVGWVVYVCWGNDFVMQLHAQEYTDFLNGDAPTSGAVKSFIYDTIFLKYVGKAAAIVLFLVATMSIVEILNNKGIAISEIEMDMLIEACVAEFNLAFLAKAKEERMEEKNNGSISET